MRTVSSAEAARTFARIREEVSAPGAAPVIVTHYNVPQAVVMSHRDYRELVRRSGSTDRVADLPEADLEFLASVDGRNDAT